MKSYVVDWKRRRAVAKHAGAIGASALALACAIGGASQGCGQGPSEHEESAGRGGGGAAETIGNAAEPLVLGACPPYATDDTACAPPTHGDCIKNLGETDVDCGGSDLLAARCKPGLDCLVGTDCTSGACVGNKCTSPSCSGLADGEPCSDGNPCTANDVCQSGACVGDAAAADGQSCDGDKCMRVNECVNGTCVSSLPVVCFPNVPDQCHATGVCDPATGACTTGAITVGAPCDDGKVNTYNDVCDAAGICQSTAPGPERAPMGCTNKVWVGATATGVCPAAPGWIAQNPFQSSLSAILSRYCMYTWAGGPGTSPKKINIDTLQHVWFAGGGIGLLTQNCAKIGPIGDIAQRERTDLRRIFNSHAGRLATAPPSHRTLVAVVDTAPTHWFFPDQWHTPDTNSHHGPQVVNVIRDLLSADGSQDNGPIGDVATELALKNITNDPPGDEVYGGFFGTPMDLAGAIECAVTKWRNGYHQVNPRLVINLSVGSPPDDLWLTAAQPILPDTAEPYTPEQAVYEALRMASCYGVAVIAAAGNDRGGSGQPTGTAYPAAWANLDAPTKLECEREMNKAPFAVNEYIAFAGNAETAFEGEYQTTHNHHPLVSHAARPLLQAVAGVDRKKGKLANALDGAEQWLVALGELAAAGDPRYLPPPLTGTSLSAAVTSAAAAAVWSYLPELTEDELRKTLYDSGEPLGGSVEGKAVHRLSVCKAVEFACANKNASNAICPLDSCALAEPDRFSCAWLNDIPAGGVLAHNSDSLPPSVTLKSIATPPWIYPLPPDPTCDVCTFSWPSGNIYMLLRVDNPKVNILSATLVLSTSHGDLYYPLPHQGNLLPGVAYNFTLAGGPPAGITIYRASISFEVTMDGQAGSVLDSIAIIPH